MERHSLFLDFSTLDVTLGCEVGLLVTLSAVFAGFETNNFLENRIKRVEQKKNAEEEFLALSQSEDEKQEEKTQEKSEKENIKL